MKRPAIIIAIVIALLGVAVWGASRTPDSDSNKTTEDTTQATSVDGGGDAAMDITKVDGTKTDQPSSPDSAPADTQADTEVLAVSDTPSYTQSTSTPAVPQTTPQQQPSAVVTPPAPAVQEPAVVTPPNGGGMGGGAVTPPVVKKAFVRPLISIEFDDNWLSGYTAGIPLVESFGWKATVNVYTQSVLGNYEGYATEAQLRDVVARGHDLGAHTITHTDLTTLDQEARAAELTESKAYVESIAGKPVDYLVTPYCATNAAVVSDAAAAGYTAIRNCDDKGVNTAATYSATSITSYNVLRSDTTEKIQGLIDQAKATNGWLVLVYHEVSETGDDHSIAPSNLSAQLQAVKDSGVEVLKTADVIADIAVPVAQP